MEVCASDVAFPTLLHKMLLHFVELGVIVHILQLTGWSPLQDMLRRQLFTVHREMRAYIFEISWLCARIFAICPI